MTAVHARRRILGRLADLARGHGPVPDPPDLVSVRVRDFGDGPKITGFDSDPYDYDWPGMGMSQPAGPGTLDALYAAAGLRSQRDQLAAEHAAFYSWGASLDAPEGLVRPYEPEPDPEPPAVTYPAPDLHADLGECPLFRDTVRACFVRQEHARGRRARDGETWMQEHARVYRERFTDVLDDVACQAVAAPYPDFGLRQVTT